MKLTLSEAPKTGFLAKRPMLSNMMAYVYFFKCILMLSCSVNFALGFFVITSICLGNKLAVDPYTLMQNTVCCFLQMCLRCPKRILYAVAFRDHLCYLYHVFVMLSLLLIADLWSPAVKELTSWLSFMIFMFLSLSRVISWVRCGT